MRSHLLGSVLVGSALLMSSMAAAQDEAADTTANSPAATGATAGPAAAVGVYPPSPTGFFRGNDPKNTNEAGAYFSIPRLVVLLGFFLFWVWAVDWIDKDSRSLSVRNQFWNSVFFACGVLGLLLGLCMPRFVLAFFWIALAEGVPLGLYISERNAKVPPSSKLLTPDHLRSIAVRLLLRVGIRMGGKKVVERTLGPDITFIGKSETGRKEGATRARQVENSRGFMAAKELVYDAILRRSTDIHLEPKENELAVRMRIDGVMYPTEPFDRALGDAIVNIFKVLGAMDITEKRKSLDGSFRAIADGREIDFRVATQGTRQGQKMSLRILDQGSSVSSLDGLGMRKQMRDQLAEIIHQPHGLLLVCGPTGAGKSTTLYAALNEIDAYQRNIITIEDPVEYKIDNVTQIEINTRAGQTFASSLRSVLRQDPDVVMVGEIRDGETANIACQAANTGHMVFSTVHANDTITALYRMIDLGVEGFTLTSSLSAILAQRLVRRLCSDCKQAYKPKAEFLKKAGLPADKITKFYRCPAESEEQVCPTCSGLGYWGRIGVFETLFINDRLRDLIRDSAALSSIRAEARKNGMLNMKEEGLRLVVKGTTSIDELLRVVK